jgi:hypothetical protein
MFFNLRFPLVLFLLSLFGIVLGLMLKILHWPGGSLTIGSMIVVQAISIIWLIIILIRGKGNNRI